MFKDLLKYEGLEEACEELFGFSGVTMLRDFGKLKKGQKLKSLWFNLETGIAQSIIENEEIVVEFPFHLDA